MAACSKGLCLCRSTRKLLQACSIASSRRFNLVSFCWATWFPAWRDRGTLQSGSFERSRQRATNRPLHPLTSIPMTLPKSSLPPAPRPSRRALSMTHRNLVASLRPLEEQVLPYRKYFRLLARCVFSGSRKLLKLMPTSRKHCCGPGQFAPAEPVQCSSRPGG